MLGEDRSLLHRFFIFVLLVSIYFFTAQQGLRLGAIGGVATPIWPPSGISLAALLLLGRQFWPGIMLGAFLTNFWATHSALPALGIALGNTLEAVTATYLLQKLGFKNSSERVRDIFVWIGAGALGSTLVSATIGVGTGWLAGVLPTSKLLSAWEAWWLGDMLGDLVVAPFLLVWSKKFKVLRRPSEIFEVFLLSTVLLVLSWVLFFSPGAEVSHFLRPYVLFPILLWATLRFGQRGAVTSSLVLSITATWGTALGLGPFMGMELTENLLALQLFVGVTAVTFLFLGALVSERRKAGEDLQESELRFKRLAQDRDDIVAIVSHDLKNPLGGNASQWKASLKNDAQQWIRKRSSSACGAHRSLG